MSIAKLIPHTVYSILCSRYQRNKLKLDDVPKMPEWQRIRLLHSSNDVSVPDLYVRRASVVQGLPGGFMGRKSSGGQLPRESTSM